MNKIHTTDQDVIATLRAVVAENPDYVYENPTPVSQRTSTCQYVHGDVPGCLVGHVLNRLGVPLDALAEREGDSAFDVAIYLFSGVSDKTWDALNSAQDSQDNGDTWAEALKAAGQA